MLGSTSSAGKGEAHGRERRKGANVEEGGLRRRKAHPVLAIPRIVPSASALVDASAMVPGTRPHDAAVRLFLKLRTPEASTPSKVPLAMTSMVLRQQVFL